MAQNRLLKELQRSEKELPTGIHVETVDNNIYEWVAYIVGPADTPYAGFIYELRMNYPNDYPFKPPKVRFITRMFHPNIADPTGEICLDLLADKWAPALTGPRLLLSIQSLLAEPNPNDPLNAAAASLYKNSLSKFNERVVAYGNEFSVKVE